MSDLLRIGKMRLVKTGPSLKDWLERWVTARHHATAVSRLRRFREAIERDMRPEPWTNLEAPMATLLHDVCDALGLSDEERTAVLGTQGMLAIRIPGSDHSTPPPCWQFSRAIQSRPSSSGERRVRAAAASLIDAVERATRAPLSDAIARRRFAVRLKRARIADGG